VTFAYTKSGFWRGVAIATIIAGTLEVLSAILFDVLTGGTPLGWLSGIAAAAWPQLDLGETGGAIAGLFFHFLIMLVMVMVYFGAAGIFSRLNQEPRRSGISYGLLLWVIMYWIVLPHRFPSLFPILNLAEVAAQLFSHIVMAGIPIAYVAKAAVQWRGPRA